MTEILYIKPRPRDMSVQTTMRLHAVGLNARRRVFARNRPEHDIKSGFDTDNPINLIRASETYTRFASIGGLAVAALDREDAFIPVGYALAKQEATGLFARFRHKSPVLLQEVNIMPGFEDEPVGVNLSRMLLGEFREKQIPVCYVAEEDVVMRGLVNQLGFNLEPSDQTPSANYQVFGTEREPVCQLRYSAPSIGAVLNDGPNS